MHDDARNPLMPRQPVTATLTVTAQEKAISDKLIGIFFEDISYAADGGPMPSWYKTATSNTPQKTTAVGTPLRPGTQRDR